MQNSFGSWMKIYTGFISFIEPYWFEINQIKRVQKTFYAKRTFFQKNTVTG